MRIEWKITKKRGNLRPVLSYCAQLEDHERALALPVVSIVSTIPRPEEERQDYCYPGQLERSPGYTPETFHTLEAPSHKGHAWTRTLVLPWREDNSYPEVDASFAMLRRAMEDALEKAYGSEPMQLEGSVRTSAGAQAKIAPGVMAEKFLRIAAKAAAHRESPAF